MATNTRSSASRRATPQSPKGVGRRSGRSAGVAASDDHAAEPAALAKSKVEVVYQELKDRILQVDLYPGHRLLIDDISRELGVSPIPVREALHRLQAEGFVKIRPYAGATVTELHAEAIVEIFRLLEALEIISAQAACARLLESDLDELDAFVESMAKMTGQPERWSEANAEFHKLICERSGAVLIDALLERVLDHWVRLRRLYLRSHTPRLDERQAEHRELMAAMRERDPLKVAHVLHEHNRQALAEYSSHLRQHYAIDDPSSASEVPPVYASALGDE